MVKTRSVSARERSANLNGNNPEIVDMAVPRTPVGGGNLLMLGSPANNNLGVRPIGEGLPPNGALQNLNVPPPHYPQRSNQFRRSLELHSALSPHVGNVGTPQHNQGQLPPGYNVPPPPVIPVHQPSPPIDGRNRNGNAGDEAAALNPDNARENGNSTNPPAHTGAIPRLRVNQFTSSNERNRGAFQQQPTYGNFGDFTNPPPQMFGNAYGFPPYVQPPYAQAGPAPAPTVNDFMSMMIEENRRRDAMFERVMQSLAPQVAGARTPNQSNMCYQVMPDLSKHIETYDGEGGGSKAYEWIRTLDGMRTLHNWPDSIALETARMHLTGGAKDWYRMHSHEFNSWEAFQVGFRQTFTTYESRTAKWQRMTGRIQKKGEATQTYYHAKIRLCAELELGVRDTKEQVLVGLWSKDLCSAMAARNHHDLEELYHDIVSYERLEEQRVSRIRSGYPSNADKSKTVPTTNTPMPNASTAAVPLKNPDTRTPIKNEAGEFKCYNCNNFGHLSRNCPEPKRPLICRACQQTGHTQRHCTASGASGSGVVQQIDGPHQDAVTKYIKTAYVNGRVLQAFVDQGSSDCTITATTVLRGGLHMEPALTELRSFGPEHYKVNSPGIVRADVTLDGVTVHDVAIRVVPDDAQATPVLVGRTFTDAPHVNYHKIGGQLFFTVAENDPLGNIQATEAQTPRLDAAETVQLPPHSMSYIRAADGRNEWFLSVLNTSSTERHVERGHTLVRGELAVVPVRDQQPSRSPIRLEELIVGPNRPPEEIDDLLKVINEYRDCVSKDISDLGCTDVIEMDITEVPNSRPIYSKPYKASNSERETIKEIVDEWKREGIVTETHSPYASPVLLVRKKTGESRLVVDFRRLNQQTERIHFPLPDIDDHLAQIGDARLFITLDLAHGYLQVPLTKSARAKTAFITPDDTGEFTRMSFGLMNAPFYFSKLMQRVLGPLRESSILFYLDDVLIPGKTWHDLRERLIKVLDALRHAGLTLKLAKCQFLMEQVTYLGYRVSKDGIEPGSDKLQGIIDFPRPDDAHGVRRFLGLTGFFRRFVPRFAERAEPLSNLLKKNRRFTWTDNEERAFLDLKGTLGTSPVLQMYSPKRRTELHTDASASGLAAMLMQADDADQLRLVYAISRRTNAPERNYHSSKLELLAIVWAVSRLRTLLINIEFKIVTDCQALVYLCANKTKNPQIVRWYALLGEFNFDIEHRPGERISHVDALSRAPVDAPNDVTELSEIADAVYTIVSVDDEIRMYQSADEVLQKKSEILRKPVRERTAHEKSEVRDYDLLEGLLYKRDGDRMLFVIPRAMRKGLTVKYHDLQSHMGTDRTLAKMKERYFFPGMRAYVKRHIRACLQCALTKPLTGRQAGLLHPIVPGKRPFETINIDHEGPFVTSVRKNKYIFAIVDNLTKYVVVKAVRDTSVRPVIRVLDDFVLDFGAPLRIISDRGTCYTSRKFAEFCEKHGIEHVLNSPRHAQANGQVERMNRTLVPAVQASVTHPDGRDWDARIKVIQRDLNEAPNKSTGISPFQALYGYTARHDEGPLRRLAPDNERDYQLPAKLQQEVRDNIERAQQQSKDRYDRGRREVQFEIGDIVCMRTVPVQTGESTKLQRRFRGPLVISKRMRGDTYGVVDLNATEQRRRYAATAHASQLKLWVPSENEGPDNEGTEDEDEVDDDAPSPNVMDEDVDVRYETESAPPAANAPQDLPPVTSLPEVAIGLPGNEETEEDVPETTEPTPARAFERPKRERKIPNYLRDYVFNKTLEDELL